MRPIAIRRLLPNGTAELYEPKEDYDGDWICEFRVIREENITTLHGHGVDALQAIHEALRGLALTVENSGMRWEAASLGASGFPHLLPLDLPIVDQQAVDAIAQERLVEFWTKNRPPRTTPD